MTALNNNFINSISEDAIYISYFIVEIPDENILGKIY